MWKNLLASFSFFTRLPLWRLADIPSECYSRVVEFWPLTGWLTGGLTAVSIWLFAQIVPILPAVMLGYVIRLLLTGALHEDGFADFIDGFGGGRTREMILEIMKDSHIGSYGVIGLIAYYILLVSLVASLPLDIIPFAVISADTWGKFCGEYMVSRLPYARKASEAKNKTVYQGIKWWMILFGASIGMLPVLGLPPFYWLSMLLPLIVDCFMISMMRSRIGGYTGDCCGAVFIMCELSFLLSANVIAGLLNKNIL